MPAFNSTEKTENSPLISDEHNLTVFPKQSNFINRLKPESKGSGRSLLQKRIQQTNFLSEKLIDSLKSAGLENRDNFSVQQHSEILKIQINRSRAQSETLISDFVETLPQLSKITRAQSDLVNGEFDIPIKDNFCFHSFSNVNDDQESIYLPEEVRIYQYLAQISVNPIDVSQYLQETRSFSIIRPKM